MCTNNFRKIIFLSCLTLFSAHAAAQNYRELSEQALEWMQKDSLSKAEELFRQALKLEPANPHNALLFSNIGMIQQRMHKYDYAIESFGLALNIAPYSVPILLNRAALYLETGNTDRAYTDYCQVLDLEKKNTEALLMRAYIYVNRRDYKAARIDYNALLGVAPDSYAGRLGLATLNQKEKRYKEALELINNLLVKHSQDPVIYGMRASVEYDMGHADLALIDLDEAIRLNPNSPDSYVLRGEIFLEQKKKTLAKADFEKAISLGVPRSELREQLLQCK